MTEFSDKVAIVAGGSLGIGRASARRLAQGGASVVVCSDRKDQVLEAVNEFRGVGLEVEGLEADVRVAADMKRLIDFATETYGGVDILVNSAGVQRYGTVVDTDEETWAEVIDVNLKGIYLTSKYAIPGMRKRGGGAIVNLSSVQAFASQKGLRHTPRARGRQRPDPSDGPRPRAREHKGQRCLSCLGRHADAQVDSGPIQGREERRRDDRGLREYAPHREGGQTGRGGGGDCLPRERKGELRDGGRV